MRLASAHAPPGCPIESGTEATLRRFGATSATDSHGDLGAGDHSHLRGGGEGVQSRTALGVVLTGRGVVEVAEATRTGELVRRSTFMAGGVLALVEHSANELRTEREPRDEKHRCVSSSASDRAGEPIAE